MNLILKRVISVIGIIGVLSGHWAMAAAPELSNVIRPKQTNVFFSDIQPSSWYYDDVMKIVDAGIMKGKSADTFDPDGKISNAEIAQILKNLQVPENLGECPDYADITENAWYTANVKAYGAYFPLHWNKYKGSAYFWPDQPIDRCDFAYTMLCGFGYSEEDIVDEYTALGNVPGGWRYYPEYALQVAASKGIVSGYADGNLGDYDEVSRAQCAAILNRLIKAAENDLL